MVTPPLRWVVPIHDGPVDPDRPPIHVDVSVELEIRVYEYGASAGNALPVLDSGVAVRLGMALQDAAVYAGQERARREVRSRRLKSRPIVFSAPMVRASLDREMNTAAVVAGSAHGVCRGCHNEIDETTCCCGSECGGRDGHPFVPMGCRCMVECDSEIPT